MEKIRFEKKDNIGYVVLNNPPVNAFSNQMYQDMADIFNEISEMKDVYVAIIRSEGKVFCAGNEVGEFANFNSKVNIIGGAGPVTDCTGAIFGCKKPVIAAVDGHAIGAGFAIAACSDFIIAAEKAQFGTPEVKVGVIAASAFGSLILPIPVARYMCLTGDLIPAEQLLQYGAVHKVVPQEKVLEVSEELAKKLIATGPLAVGYFKQSFNENLDAKLMEKYFHDVSYTANYYKTHDFKEAVAAFLEKRAPKFTGQ